jgi:predicted nucleic acid-binding protein
VILVDTSAWIDFDRASGSSAHLTLARLIADGRSIASTEPVRMELLAGTRRPTDRDQVERLMRSVEWISVDPLSDFDAAAYIYAACRARGITPSGLIDCMIAAIAMRTGASLLAADEDFSRIAEILPLTLVQA